MDDPFVASERVRPRQGHWKLWHLSALVASAGVVSGMARDPGLLILLLVVTAAALVPIALYRGSEALDDFLGRSARGNPTPVGLVKTRVAEVLGLVLALTGSGLVLAALIIALILWL